MKTLTQTAALLTGLLAGPSAADAAPGARLAADERVRLDGLLDEAAWQRAAALDDLRQSQPVPGAPGSQHTVVRLAWDDANLFIAVEAFDTEPRRIVARQMQRDSELFFDDHVTVVLDPHGRGREGYLFRVNPLGARSDAMIFEGQEQDRDWDGRWRAATRVHAAGWTVEIAIPFTTLSVDTNTTAWGTNVERRVARNNERVRLAGELRETPIGSLADTLALSGIQVASPGLGLRLEPYLVLRESFDHDGDDSRSELSPGIDVFYQVTPAITAGLTINTDFAEAEVDEQRVNLTRFPLFFPEKREFFLQDTALFRFGGLGQSPLPFFSRRIGLDEAGNPVDIDVGGKLSGRQGRLAFGTLGARVAAGPNTPAATLGVARAAYELAPGLSAGVIGTTGDPRVDRDAHTLGADLQYRNSDFAGTGKTLYTEAWWQDTHTEGAPGGGAWGFAIDYPNTGLVANARFNHIDQDYDPALGFVFQTGIREGSGELGYWLRPDGYDAVIPQFDWAVRERFDGGLEYVLYNPEVYVENRAGDYVFPELRFERERLFEPFEILPGIVIPPGEYRYNRALLSAGTSRDRALSVEASVLAGDYFTGQRRDYELEFLWQPTQRYNIALEYEVTDIDLPEGRFIVRVMEADLNVNFSTRLALNLTAQHDNVSERLGLNGRLRWTFAEHHDLFFVVNHDLSTLDDEFRRLDTETIAKVALSVAL